MTVIAPTSYHSPADSPGFWFLGTKMTLRASGDTTRGAFGLIEQVAPAGFAAPPHIHRGEDEAFFLLSGAARFHSGPNLIDARAGSLVWLPRDQQHWFEVDAEGPATLLQLNTPAGLERFFVEMGTPLDVSANPPAGAPDFGRLNELAARYRIELLPGVSAR